MTEPLWAFSTLLDITNGRSVGPQADSVNGISIDSRTIDEGDAFIAIRGQRLDGHDYVGAALARGAVVAIVAQEKLAGLGRIGGPLLVVDDVMKAMRRLAVAARARFSGKIVAVTGSAGKTTTKDMLRLALAPSGNVHAAPASFNNHWGVPLSLARMPDGADFGVFEIGMNHPGEITSLAAMVRPHAAIITMIAAGHLGAFAGVDEIAHAKAEIFAGIEPGGTAILNRDDRHFELLAGLARAEGVARIVGFGEHPEAEIRLLEVTLVPAGSTVQAEISGKPVGYSLSVPGAHIVANSLAVLAAVDAFGADLGAAAKALADFAAGEGRGDRTVMHLPEGSALLIDESYNANPASMRAALSVLARDEPEGRGRRVAVLGDMLELGKAELAHHAALAEPLIAASVDRVYLVGPSMAALWEVLPSDRRAVYSQAATELGSVIARDLGPGDVVMVKGSNGIQMATIVEALKRRFAAAADVVRQGAN